MLIVESIPSIIAVLLIIQFFLLGLSINVRSETVRYIFRAMGIVIGIIALTVKDICY